ncbi:hypothetical protein J6590_085621 [Homalodisca vitripennis]|nr:hypothetical protein J6590_045199 [Homalodisca vitripennis]KAG8295190.1 hypothetical protein J6590_085621 [Homalodisca vitripennis]
MNFPIPARNGRYVRWRRQSVAVRDGSLTSNTSVSARAADQTGSGGEGGELRDVWPYTSASSRSNDSPQPKGTVKLDTIRESRMSVNRIISPNPSSWVILKSHWSTIHSAIQRSDLGTTIDGTQGK